MTITKVRSYSTVEVCEAADLTYRMLDYWAHQGVIPGEHTWWETATGEPRSHGGSGHRRRFAPEAIGHLIVVRRVQNAFTGICGHANMGANTDFLAQVYQASMNGEESISLGLVTVCWQNK